jgi:hypothetical protein
VSQPPGNNAPIGEGHISCTLLHIGNVSYRLGQSLKFDPQKQAVIGDERPADLRGIFGLIRGSKGLIPSRHARGHPGLRPGVLCTSVLC